MRLGVFSDSRYQSHDRRLWSHQAFISFVTALPPRVDELVLFGRVEPTPTTSHYELPRERIRFVPLPHYPSITSVGGQLRAVRKTRRIFEAELERLDGAWIFGPHPMASALAWTAKRRGFPLALGVRQDYPRYIAARLPSRKWGWAVGAAYALDSSFRALARSTPTVAVGDDLAAKYRGGRAPVLSTGFSLVRADDVVDAAEAFGRSWDGEIRLLSVGRLDPEKNPLLLLDILERLRHQGSWRLTIAGDGPLADELAQSVAERGLGDAVDLVGYVAQGERLRALYRAHHAFVHVALTEGFPQVLFEAQAAGLPFVATDVGGVGAFLQRSGAGLLVPPADADAAAAALLRLRDPELRRRLIESGLRSAHEETTEAQLDRIADFLRENLRR
jgi:glycosyltransferase involved in cell wall biosynthesis